MNVKQIKETSRNVYRLYFEANLSLNSGYRGISPGKLARMVNIGRRVESLNLAKLRRRINHTNI